jgi:hypothetical protein
MTNHLPKLEAILPKVKEAEAAFNTFLANMPTSTTNAEVYAEADKFNVVLREAVEAFIEDTAEVNSRSTVESVYLRIPAGCFTIGGLSYESLRWACEMGRAP